MRYAWMKEGCLHYKQSLRKQQEKQVFEWGFMAGGQRHVAIDCMQSDNSRSIIFPYRKFTVGQNQIRFDFSPSPILHIGLALSWFQMTISCAPMGMTEWSICGTLDGRPAPCPVCNRGPFRADVSGYHTSTPSSLSKTQKCKDPKLSWPGGESPVIL